MCVKLLPRNLNSGPFLPHATNTYTYGVTNTPTMCDGKLNSLYNKNKIVILNYKAESLKMC